METLDSKRIKVFVLAALKKKIVSFYIIVCVCLTV